MTVAVSGRKEADKENAGAFKPASAGRGVASPPIKGWVEGADEDEEDEEGEGEDGIDADEEDGLGDLWDSDVDGEAGEDGNVLAARGLKWLQADRTTLYEYVLGPDADDVFKLLQVNRKRVFRKVSSK